MDEIEARLATETHNRLHWQEEAERLNRLVHALRRELHALRNDSALQALRVLHAAASGSLPLARYADLRWDPARRGGAVAALEAAIKRAEGVLEVGQRTVSHG